MTSYPSIAHGDIWQLPSYPAETPCIIQAKVDGSQLTVRREEHGLLFYNKGKRLGTSKVFLNAIISLTAHEDIFQHGYYYHGEAVCSTQHNLVQYNRTPNYYWVLYEVSREDGYVLTPSETLAHIQGTGIEVVDTLYQGPYSGASMVIDRLLREQPSTLLGGGFEGVVLKVLNSPGSGNTGYTQSRRKFVCEGFQESRDPGARSTVHLSEDEFLADLGLRYNVPARLHKGWQRCRERDMLTGDTVQDQIIVNKDLDADLEEECGQTIRSELLIYFLPKILQGARAQKHGASVDAPHPTHKIGASLAEKYDMKDLQDAAVQSSAVRDALYQMYMPVILPYTREGSTSD